MRTNLVQEALRCLKRCRVALADSLEEIISFFEVNDRPSYECIVVIECADPQCSCYLDNRHVASRYCHNRRHGHVQHVEDSTSISVACVLDVKDIMSVE